MKIAIIQDVLYEHLGLCYVSAVLKKGGHTVDLIVPSEHKGGYINLIKDAEIALFPCSVTMETWFLEKATEVKTKLNIPTIFGGPHTTFYPEVIKNSQVDYIVRGEAEYAVLDLVNAISSGKDTSNIPNVGTKDKLNPLRPFIEDLDKLPFADRELYGRYKFLKNLPTKRILSGRGCTGNCLFCYVPALRKTYKDKDGKMNGKYLRKRSVKNVIEEIKFIQSKYKTKTIRFVDDTFGWNLPWVKEFIKEYKKEVNLPFTFLFIAGELDEEAIRLLSETNVSSVYFGIESGVERIRIDIYNKRVTDNQIYETAKLLKKYKIKFGTYNMVGNPTETVDEAFETLKMNAKIGADYPNCTVAQPYPKTGLHEYAKSNNLLENEGFSSMFAESNFKLKEKRSYYENLQKLFYIGVRFPSLIPLIRKLIKLPPNPLFKAIMLATYAHRSFKSFNLGFFDSLKLGLKMRKNLFA